MDGPTSLAVGSGIGLLLGGAGGLVVLWLVKSKVEASQTGADPERDGGEVGDSEAGADPEADER